MTPTPPSTASSSAGHSPDVQYRVVRKRNRIPLSCAPCRHRKLKCNRGQPCDNCVKRGDVPSCTYATLGSRKKPQSSHGTSSSPDEMQIRIDRLEGLVLSLMTNGAQSAGPAAAAAAISGSISGSSQDAPLDVDGSDMIKEEDGEDSDVDQVAKSIGVMKVDNNKAMFASEAHWYTLLSDISEVKNYFAEHKKQYEEQMRKVKAADPEDDSPGTAFLFRARKPLDASEVLAGFPQKPVVDMLVARYFDTYDPAVDIIHGPTFQKQYDRHWVHPSETPVIWYGLVFAMMCLALQSYQRVGDEPPEYQGKTREMCTDYRRKTAQCLIIEDFTQPVTHMLETLILHVQAEYARSKDAETGILFMVSLMVRLGQKMGYHRDPKPYPAITPFQGEMRRRVWAYIRTADLLFSYQAGQPPMVRSCDTNTELPSNLYDDELFEEMKELPPSHPLTETTPATYMIAKASLIFMFGKVVETVQTLEDTPYEEIIKLDRALRDTRDAVPPQLQLQSVEESIGDAPQLLIQRINIDLHYLKALCVLHRKYLNSGRESSRYSYSRRTCIEASLAMLEHQRTIHMESQPGGLFSNVKWCIYSLTTHDFLLAAMIVCLDLHHLAEAERSGRAMANDACTWSMEQREESYAALTQSILIWEGLRDQSIEAYKAYTILSVMLNKLKSQKTPRPSQQGYGYSSNALGEDSNVAPEHSAAMTLGMLSSGGALKPDGAPNYRPQQYQPATGAGLGDASQQQRQLQQQQAAAGLMPQPAGPSSSIDHSGESQFSLALADGAGFQSMALPATVADWDVWDSFIQGTTMDTTGGLWPMNMDIPTSLTEDQGAGTAPQQDPQMNSMFSGNAGMYMGFGPSQRNA